MEIKAYAIIKKDMKNLDLIGFESGKKLDKDNFQGIVTVYGASNAVAGVDFISWIENGQRHFRKIDWRVKNA